MNQNIPKIIKDIRSKNNYTQQQLADILGVTYQAVSKWENGKNLPDVAILQDISEKFNIDIELLFTGKKKKKKLTLVVLSILILAIIGFGISFILNDKESFEFQNLISNNKDFKVNGVIAFSAKQTSIYISDIKTTIKDDTKYSVLECTLYELNGKSHTMISKCGDISDKEACKNNSLSELLKNVTFNIKDFSRSCKNFENNDLYLDINVIDEKNKNINYKVPLLLEKKCT